MCVAIYKPAGVKAPSLETLRACWDANPDGAGMAYNARKGGFAISKGFMKWEKFEEAYKALSPDNTHLQMFFHFRIATHGSVRPGNCHPFPVSNKLSELQACHGRYDAVLMHNGVLPLTPVLKDTSDSQELARRLAAFTDKKDLTKAIELIGELVGTSKVAIWLDKKVYLLGSWQKHEDCYFSNLHWQYRTCTYSASTGSTYYGCGYRGYYGDDDYDYDYSGGGYSGSTSTAAITSKSSFQSQFPKKTEEDETDADPMWAEPDEVEAILTGICPLCGDQLIKMSEKGGVCQKCNIEWIIDKEAPGWESLQSLGDNDTKLLTNSTDREDTTSTK